jgi:hypothetical protein
MADGSSDVRVLITVRADYFNLASGIKDASCKPALFERLTADNNAAILRLKAMSTEGIKEAVCRPLKLAGEGDEVANKALLETVQSDISHQASDLPLLQVALRAPWQEHKATGRPMLECYQSVGRVSGALAREADKARDRLPQDDQGRLESIFVRLLRLGETGGATRRPVAGRPWPPDARNRPFVAFEIGLIYGRKASESGPRLKACSALTLPGCRGAPGGNRSWLSLKNRPQRRRRGSFLSSTAPT